MAKQARFGRYYILSALMFSVFLSFHLMTGGAEFLKIMKDNYNYSGSPVFFLQFSLLAAFFIALITALSIIFRVKQDKKQDKYAFFAAAALLVLDFIMSYFKYIDRAWLGLYNSIFAFAVIALCLWMKFFNEEKIDTKEKWPVYFLAAAAAAVTVMGVLRAFSFHDTFFTMAKDMGVVMNAMWRTWEDGTQFTYLDGYRDQRGAHFQPVIYLFAAFFRTGCHPHVLLFLQAAFSFSAVFFLYLLAEKLLEN
jgi:hypothetical protein